MAALQRDSDVRWYERELAELYPPFAAVASAERRQWIRASIQRASAFGLGRPEFFQFFCFEQTYPPGCLDDPTFAWARRILEQQDQAPSERIQKLRKETIRRLIEEEERQQRAEEAQAGEQVS